MTNQLVEGQKAPDFMMVLDNGESANLSHFAGKNLVLYFYPKDDTPGCTLEGKDFSALKAEFDAANTEVLGVSKDDTKSHVKFKEKHCFTFNLASDVSGKTCDAYGCFVEKSMYGKKYMGIERSTFLIDMNGIIRKIWNKVSVTGHAKAVLVAAKGL